MTESPLSRHLCIPSYVCYFLSATWCAWLGSEGDMTSAVCECSSICLVCLVCMTWYPYTAKSKQQFLTLSNSQQILLVSWRHSEGGLKTWFSLLYIHYTKWDTMECELQTDIWCPKLWISTGCIANTYVASRHWIMAVGCNCRYHAWHCTSDFCGECYQSLLLTCSVCMIWGLRTISGSYNVLVHCMSQSWFAAESLCHSQISIVRLESSFFFSSLNLTSFSSQVITDVDTSVPLFLPKQHCKPITARFPQET